MQIDTTTLTARDAYKLLTGAIMPRPIAWVSTISEDGVANLAPFSFFTAVASDPPTIVFCPGVRSTDGGQKDTLHNVRATREFVVNFVTEELAQAMNQTAAELPSDMDEFAYAGVTPVPSTKVRPYRVAESPIQFECILNQIVTIHEGVGGGHLVIGEVKIMHVADELFQDGYYIDQSAYFPIGRLVASGYCTTRDRFELERPASQIPPKMR